MQQLRLSCRLSRFSVPAHLLGCHVSLHTGHFWRLQASGRRQQRTYAAAALPTEVKAPRKAASNRRSSSAAAAEAYDADQIQVLEGLEPVRKRPGMYIGSTGQRGLHHLVYEVLDNAVDEVQAGHATQVDVDMDLRSGWVSVTDNGRGIPTDVHNRTGKSALETVLTVLHAGGKFGGDASGYSVSGGLHGVGISVVNALSERLEVRVWRAGKEHSQSYSRGAALTPLTAVELPPAEADRRGTQVRFVRDPLIFEKDVSFDPNTIRARLRELAYLNSSAVLRFRAVNGRTPVLSDDEDDAAAAAARAADDEAASSSSDADEANDEQLHSNGATVRGTTDNGVAGSSSSSGRVDADGWQTFHYEGGLREYVAYVNRGKGPLHDPIFIHKHVQGIEVEVVLQWCSKSYSDSLVGFANSIKTIDGGTHMDGLRTALTRMFNALGRKTKLLKEGAPNLQGEHVREGLGAIVSVKVPNPEFEGQTKTRLGNPEVRKIVDKVLTEDLGEWLEMNPATFGIIIEKALRAAEAAEAAKKARELVRRKNVLTRSTLPGKLADCTSSNRAETEIFVVEGDSAGGSAKMARDRRTQAVLPLRGKILNVDRKDDKSMYENKELGNLIVALGLGAKGDAAQVAKQLRYGKIIILTDADVDGAHIRTLLLTFLFRYQPELFRQGRIFAAVPPLHKVEHGKVKHYCYTDAELKAYLKTIPASPEPRQQRFKGLGEMMPNQLWDTTLDPSKRLLRRLTTNDAEEAGRMLDMLMGDKVGPRREFIESRASNYSLEQLDI